jgi:hypothetical protein
MVYVGLLHPLTGRGRWAHSRAFQLLLPGPLLGKLLRVEAATLVALVRDVDRAPAEAGVVTGAPVGPDRSR